MINIMKEQRFLKFQVASLIILTTAYIFFRVNVSEEYALVAFMSLASMYGLVSLYQVTLMFVMVNERKNYSYDPIEENIDGEYSPNGAAVL